MCSVRAPYVLRNYEKNYDLTMAFSLMSHDGRWAMGEADAGCRMGDGDA